MKELEIDALKENLPKVLAFVDEELESVECPMLTQTTIDIAVEELFVNIASYAYESSVGNAVIQIEILREPLSAVITFIDSGKEYNPLAKEDPDITLSLHERKEGGLGIYMVKQSMDDVAYEYKDGKNIFTIRKILD